MKLLSSVCFYLFLPRSVRSSVAQYLVPVALVVKSDPDIHNNVSLGHVKRPEAALSSLPHVNPVSRVFSIYSTRLGADLYSLCACDCLFDTLNSPVKEAVQHFS